MGDAGNGGGGGLNDVRGAGGVGRRGGWVGGGQRRRFESTLGGVSAVDMMTTNSTDGTERAFGIFCESCEVRIIYAKRVLKYCANLFQIPASTPNLFQAL